jgi:signal transduction histidine kinase
VVAVPVTANEHVIGAIRAEQPTGATDRRTLRIFGLIGAIGAGVIAIGAAIGFVVAGRLARPVQQLSDAAVRLGDGDFSIIIPPSGIPELDGASNALTATAGQLDDVLRRERAFSADVSHQLRTPLAGLRAAIETEIAFPRPDRANALHEALEDVDRIERTITEMLTIARNAVPTRSTMSLQPFLAGVANAWNGTFADAGRKLSVDDSAPLSQVHGNATMLRHAVDVVLDNALHHGGGAVRVETHVTGDAVTIAVSDEGSGFPVAVPPADGDEHGLGLPLARRLVEAMPGRLTTSRPGERAVVTFVLARAES